MKNTKNTLTKWLMAACVLIVGAQSAFALDGQVCAEGTIYLQAPKTWTAAFAAGGGKFVPFTKGDTWWTVKSSSVGQGQDTTFFISSKENDYCQLAGITGSQWDQTACDQKDGIPCSKSGDLYIFEDPTTPGKTVYSENPPDAKYIYVMIPPDFEDWMSAVPMISLDGGLTGKALTADADKCGWYYYVFFNEEITDNVVFYRDDDTDRADMIGLNGNWETGTDATPIPMGMMFDTYEALGVNTLYFVPDEEQLLASGDDGWYDVFPEGVAGKCSYDMAAIIYDTDASLHPAFSCYSSGGEGCQIGAQGIDQMTAVTAVNRCIGVTPGIVEQYLDPNIPQKMRKPKLSTFGKNCFISDALFNQLFNYTKGVNEKSCYNMPFERSSDGKWEFDSDFFVSKGLTVPGGFYPVETTDNTVILEADPTQTPVPAARTKRGAEGAIFYGPALRENHPTEGEPLIDVYCNSSSWKGGDQCEGLFADGDGTDAAIQTFYKLPVDNKCVIGWSCPDKAPKGWTFYKDGTETVVKTGGSPRWSAQRNQHYCFESHAQFTYKPGLKFNFRGDDDIWVFIDNTLAVDLGGTHLAAPGYVKLDNFKGYGGRTLEVGNQYPIDIFFCDRRTTMSNVRIKTNMYIQQQTSITAKGVKDPKNKAVTSYSICYNKTGEGSCASAFSEDDKPISCCDNDFLTNPDCKGFAMEYYLVKGTEFKEETAELLPSGVKSHGGIDLTVPTSPKVDKKNLSLEPGRWTLYVKIDGEKRKVVSFKQAGDVDVVSADAVANWFDEDGEKIIATKTYKVTKTAPAGSGSQPSSEADLVPVYISAIVNNEDGSIEIQPDDAVGWTYSLDFPSGMLLFKKIDGKLTQILTTTSNTIGSYGVDTVYAYVPSAMLTKSSETFSIKVAGRSAEAKILFYVPRLAFVDTLYKDAAGAWVFSQNTISKDTVIDPSTGLVEERMTGMAYNFFVVALKPNDAGTGYENCTECNLKFTMTGSSQGISALDSNLRIENGGAIIQVRSMKQYPATGTAAQIVAYASKNSYAVYSPIYFSDPPCPIPAFADVFDMEGAKSSVPMQIPAPYFDSETEYQDGIADMVDIYYNRMIPKDSVPLAVCIEWESSTATKFYPAKETVEIGGKSYPLSSKDGKDDYILCNDVIYQDRMDTAHCDQVRYEDDAKTIPVKDSVTGKVVDYCDQRIRVTGLKLSNTPKTAGPGKVTSFSAYMDRNKNVVTQGFPSEVMIDRMAPIPVSATVISKKNGKGEYVGQDVMTITMSEPVKIVSTDKFKVFDFYLYNAKGKIEDLYSSATDESSFIVTTQVEPTPDDDGLITAVYKTKNADGSEPITPHKDDYLRLSGTMEKIFWTDKTDINLGGADSIRAIVRANNPDEVYTDETYMWNSPTGYAETRRLPSPWVEISGSADHGLYSHSFAYSTYAKTDTASIVVNAYSKFRSEDEIIDKENGIPGWFVKADMLSLYNLLSTEKRQELAANLDKIYFSYKIEVFTNLGNYVAGKSGRVYCDDKTNKAKYGRTFFGDIDANKTCLDAGTNRNYYIGWNMISDDGRAVGTGAYISKVQTFVKLGGKKDSEQSDTKIWGVKKMAQGYKEYQPKGDVFPEDF